MEDLKTVLDEILDSIQSEKVLDPFDAGVVSTVAIIKLRFGIE